MHALDQQSEQLNASRRRAQAGCCTDTAGVQAGSLECAGAVVGSDSPGVPARGS